MSKGQSHDFQFGVLANGELMGVGLILATTDGNANLTWTMETGAAPTAITTGNGGAAPTEGSTAPPFNSTDGPSDDSGSGTASSLLKGLSGLKIGFFALSVIILSTC